MQPIFPGLFRDVVDSVFRSIFINEIIPLQICRVACKIIVMIKFILC